MPISGFRGAWQSVLSKFLPWELSTSLALFPLPSHLPLPLGPVCTPLQRERKKLAAAPPPPLSSHCLLTLSRQVNKQKQQESGVAGLGSSGIKQSTTARNGFQQVTDIANPYTLAILEAKDQA